MDLLNLGLMNAAGWCKLPDTVEKLAKTPVTEITVGSITVHERPGNDGITFWQSPDGFYAINSLGLPNPGIEKYRELLPIMHKIARDAGKQLRVSIAGFSPQEYADLADVAIPHADTIEINLGCPNVWGAGGQKPIASFDLPLMRDIIHRVVDVAERGGPVRISAKLSPYSDPGLFGNAISVLKDFRHFLHEAVTSNTFPNAIAYENGKPAITPAGGFGGLSGKAMKAIALGQSTRLRSELSWNDFQVVHTGGIATGQDIRDCTYSGVRLMQIGTHYFVHGEKVFGELATEYAELI